MTRPPSKTPKPTGSPTRGAELAKYLDDNAISLDEAFHFRQIADNGTLPPVLAPIERPHAPLHAYCASVAFKIAKPAQPYCKNIAGACNPVSWRDYLYSGLDQPDLTAEQTDAIALANFRVLVADYTGMLISSELIRLGRARLEPSQTLATR